MATAARRPTTTRPDPDLVPDARGAVAAPDPGCPVEVALDAIRGRWATLILRELMGGPRSFGDLRGALPTVSTKVLTDRLEHLRASGLVVRSVNRAFPPTTSWALTSRGRLLRPLLLQLWETGAALLADPGHPDPVRARGPR